uniref:Uncharacterized protein n=1 Tax=Myotis myotis TaxID=51298 RepID=A0A7J7XH83_MYOMY|nr:hypothetical protein mMyoMyo1_011616 [Myotis myotis]
MELCTGKPHWVPREGSPVGGSPGGQPGRGRVTMPCGRWERAVRPPSSARVPLLGTDQKGPLVFVLGCETPSSREWETVCRAHCLRFQTKPSVTASREGHKAPILRPLRSSGCCVLSCHRLVRGAGAAKGLGEGRGPSAR